MVILDTDHVSLLEWRDRPDTVRLRTRLNQLPSEEAATTVISYEEQVRGWMAYIAKARSLRDQVDAYRRLANHLRNYRTIEVLEFDELAAARFQDLKRQRIRIGTPDLKIAAIVLARDALLLSRNRSDFLKVPGLRVEDWTA